MAEANEGSKKQKAEVTNVTMEDGRVVGFAGSRKMNKDYLIDADTQTVTAVIDFRNGRTVRLAVGPDLLTTGEDQVPLLLQAAGHGLVQKLGDEAASEKDVDDAYMAVDDLRERLEKGDWRVVREAGGFQGASIVVQAIIEAKREKGQEFSVQQVKDFLQGILDAEEAKGNKISRAKLYESFRNPKSRVGQIVKRLEEEKAAKSQSAVDADALVAGL